MINDLRTISTLTRKQGHARDKKKFAQRVAYAVIPEPAKVTSSVSYMSVAMRSLRDPLSKYRLRMI